MATLTGDFDTVRTIDITPTWAALLPALLNIIRYGETVEAIKLAEGELLRMAKALDAQNARIKAEREHPFNHVCDNTDAPEPECQCGDCEQLFFDHD